VYVPKVHKEERISILQEAIRRAGLATLVSLTDDGLVANHVPLLLDTEPGPSLEFIDDPVHAREHVTPIGTSRGGLFPGKSAMHQRISSQISWF
jgi:hypothetical protein